MNEIEMHQSQRGYFAHTLYKYMKVDLDIWVITGDVGFGMLDRIRADFPERFINTGAAEQAMMGVGVGLALEGRKPFVYSITPFLLYRSFETIRNYIEHEGASVRMVGSGRDNDYIHDGFSHWAQKVEDLFCVEDNSGVNRAPFKNITALWPQTQEEVPEMVRQMVEINKPWFLSLSR